MHSVVGTALGGAFTIVGEPQNIIIGERLGWGFMEYLYYMYPVAIPVLIAGLIVTSLLELTGKLGYGAQMPESVRNILKRNIEEADADRTNADKGKLMIILLVGMYIIVALGLHVAEVGIIGLSILIAALFVGEGESGETWEKVFFYFTHMAVRKYHLFCCTC